MTKVTASPMLAAVETLPETPRKGQQPRNFEKMKLLVSTQLTKNKRTFMHFPPLPAVPAGGLRR